MREARDVFNSNTSYFVPALALCFSPALLIFALDLLAAPRAARIGFVSEPLVAVMVWAIPVFTTLFCLQLYKAAATLLLCEAVSRKSFRPFTRSVARRLVSGLPEFIRTQWTSLADLRWTSYRDNLLWPVVWAQEGLSGRAALARSRLLCRAVPSVSLTMVPRQYSPTVVAMLVMPTVFAALSGAEFTDLIKMIYLSGLRFVSLELLIFPIAIYMRYGVAFPFLYRFAVVCRGEGAPPGLPPAGVRTAKETNPVFHRAVLFWSLAPVVMLLTLVISPGLHRRTSGFLLALSDGRSAAILKEIDSGVNVDASDFTGMSALHGAVRRGDAALAQELLARGANVNARASDGTTPLMLAAEYNRANLAAALLDHGALPASANSAGRTALMLAAIRGSSEIVALLLAHGADTSVRDDTGKTALDYALAERHSDAAALLGR
jgi:hypothetical protein